MIRSTTLWLVMVLAACTRPSAPERAPAPSQADLSMRGVTVRSYSGGELRVVTTADQLEAFREVGTPGDLIAHDAGITIVRDGTVLNAPLVTGNFLSGQLEASGGVTMLGRNDSRGDTERVFFDRSIGVASSDAGLIFTQPGTRLTASSFVIELNDEHVTFTDAKTEISPR